MNSIAAITVCNEKAEIIYMNQKAQSVFAKYGDDLKGQSLFDCHNAHSASIIRKLLTEGGSNVYTIEKNGIRKLIHQSAWYTETGCIGGLTEISMEIPFDMPHFIR
ncbi:MAG TPA: PAS sensor protein [Bacteroidales bacterium]|nr:MAG: PAS sensor protein [Bacteroidetes bacterium HGW-Bacteroidetes-22]HAQ65041.1 PAS sensor protein [Bacteroidales bacterium]HBZ65917.1 PAS sensor protein [Bacteroidales bacterium]